MAKLSAGILAYRFLEVETLQVLLVHPGGPYFTKKDLGVWSIPKGEYLIGEDPLEAAKREFKEETGNVVSADYIIKLTDVKLKSGKVVSAWGVETDFENCFIESNFFEMEWPPKSGKKQSFAEVDKAEWFTIPQALEKISEGQRPFLIELEKLVSSNRPK